MSPAAPDVSHRVPTTNSLATPSTAGGMVKFNGKNYKQWAMYMEALHVHRGVWDVVSGLGSYNPGHEDQILAVIAGTTAGFGQPIVLLEMPQ
ncbi:hypothetical protein V1524DRAFT_440827 [Lipomyces starkeyi]